jgi:galactokinase
MIGIFLALANVNRLGDTAQWRRALSTLPELGGYLGAMENGLSFGALEGDSGVGTLGGSQDQTAIFCAEPNHIVDFGWMPVRRLGAYALPDTHCFVVASSGVVAEKSAGARDQYNRASLLVKELLALWNATTGRSDASLAAAVESGTGAPDALRAMIPANATERFSAGSLRQRLDQFLLETYTLIPAAATAFAAQDWPTLGTVTARSQQAAESWLGNQVPETMALVRFARERGAIAASAFGAGFGGSVWALIERAQAPDFIERWSDAYRRAFFAQGVLETFFQTDAGPAAMHWSDDDALTR